MGFGGSRPISRPPTCAALGSELSGLDLRIGRGLEKCRPALLARVAAS